MGRDTIYLALGTAIIIGLSGCGGTQQFNDAKMEAEQHASMPSAQTPPGLASGATVATPSAPVNVAKRSAPEGRSGTGGGTAGGVTDSNGNPRLTLASLSESQSDRYLIKNANITIETADVRGAAEKAKDAAKGLQGYVSNSHETTDGLGQKSVTVEVRVPSAQFDASVSRIATLGRVLDNTVTSDDVSEEFVDTDAKLRNLKKTELRLLDHLSHTGALHDTLEVEGELTRVRQEIEELEGKLRFMAHRISFSTLTLAFKEPAHAQPITPTESFSIGQVTSEAARSFIGFLQSALSLAVWASVWSVVWAPSIWILRRIYVKLRGSKQAAANQTPQSTPAV